MEEPRDCVISEGHVRNAIAITVDKQLQGAFFGSGQTADTLTHWMVSLFHSLKDALPTFILYLCRCCISWSVCISSVKTKDRKSCIVYHATIGLLQIDSHKFEL